MPGGGARRGVRGGRFVGSVLHARAASCLNDSHLGARAHPGRATFQDDTLVGVLLPLPCVRIDMDRPESSTVRSIEARLTEATARGEPLEVILSVRGRVRAAGPGRWRIRTADDHILTFRAEAVVAVTPAPKSRPESG